MHHARSALVALALVVALGSANRAVADAYPSRPITVVVAFAAGGPTDTIARIVTERMSVSLKQSIVVENVSGAAGSIGTGRVARASPDGYTLTVGYLGTHVLNGALYSLQYDVLKDFAPIALLASNPQLIVAKKATPAKDLTELVAWLKANPGKAAQGTGGLGTPSHISGGFFQKATGTSFQFVHYRGAAPAIQDLVGGHIDLMVDQASNALPHVRDGNIRAFAVTARTRLASAPDIPTAGEAGLPNFHLSIWAGMWAPAGTPHDVIDKLNAAVKEALADAAVQKRLADLGQDVPPRDRQSPAALAAFQEAEMQTWWPIIRAMNLQAK